MVVPRARVALRGVPGAQLAVAGIAQGHLEYAQILEESSGDRSVPTVEVDCSRVIPTGRFVVCSEAVWANCGAYCDELGR